MPRSRPATAGTLHRPATLVALLVLLGAAPLGLGVAGNEPPAVGEIKAELKPPVTIYSVRAVDPRASR